jgi:hypothetical protein
MASLAKFVDSKILFLLAREQSIVGRKQVVSRLTKMSVLNVT